MFMNRPLHVNTTIYISRVNMLDFQDCCELALFAGPTICSEARKNTFKKKKYIYIGRATSNRKYTVKQQLSQQINLTYIFKQI